MRDMAVARFSLSVLFRPLQEASVPADLWLGQAGKISPELLTEGRVHPQNLCCLNAVGEEGMEDLAVHGRTRAKGASFPVGQDVCILRRDRGAGDQASPGIGDEKIQEEFGCLFHYRV